MRRILIGHALGRSQPITPAELAFAEELFMPLLNDEPPAPEEMVRAASYASLGHAFLATAADPQSGSSMSDKVTLERSRPSAALTSRLDPHIRAAVRAELGAFAKPFRGLRRLG